MSQFAKAGFSGTTNSIFKKIFLCLSFFGLLLVITGLIHYNRSMSNNCVPTSGKEELIKLVSAWENQYATPPTTEQIEELVATFPDENAVYSERVVLSWETLK